jgi:hypothetical protein
MNYKDKLLKIKINDRNENDFKNYLIMFFNNWFVKLNKIDLKILYNLTFFLIFRIKSLFNINNNDLLFQFSKNNNQDIKAITFLFLPFLYDEETNIYNKLQNLSEIVCSKIFTKDFLEIEKNKAMKEHFKYSTIAIGLIQKDNTLENDLIYRIIYNKFQSLLNTLTIINGKLYVNWINISPLTLDNYKSSYIYNETITSLEDTIYEYFDGTNSLYYNGLYIGEFYNVYRNILFENIKKIKWIIFPYSINGHKQYLLQYLNDILNLDLLLENYIFDELTFQQQEEFISNVRNNKITSNNNLIWKNFILFMVNNYTHKLILFENNSELQKIKNIFVLKDNDNEDIDNDYSYSSLEKIRTIQDYHIDIFLKNIDPKYVWDYISESLIQLKNTIFYDYLIKNNKISKIFFEFGDCNLKNLYNIAKSLSHSFTSTIKKHRWEILAEKYDALSDDEKQKFWDKFFIINNNWLNIKKNLEREFNNELTDFEYENMRHRILESWNRIKYDIVWEYLVKNGLLSEFNVFKNVNLKDKFSEHPEWKDAYYFINNQKFSELQNINNMDYFTYLCSKFKWYGFYAMDWISQINFFNHYINHRVLFVTGATGQGKSTQVPKLFLYSVKMLDYKLNGKIVCTVPRINITIGNSERISLEMGVPIKIENKKYGKLKTDNYHLQYKYSKDNHIKINCPHPTLKLSTDGSLFQELIKNGLLKEQLFNKKKKDDEFIYTYKNLYDVIIIDESHEHNVYMDLLTTIIRNSIYYNNDVRFVIMSATLDEDEPIYRTYFKYINDNLIYPITKPILDPFNKNNKILIDRIYLDRRFHISPPGKTTQYKITEHYLDYKIINDNQSDSLNSDLTLKKSYEIIQNICNETQKGDILLFANGMKDILNSVEYLNKILPEGVITLPYFSQLNNKYIDIILNIDKTIGTIQTKRFNVHKLWSTNYIEEKIPDKTYKRAVIIATNVAEASLTLPSLRYVVETGYTKTNIYDFVLDNYNFNIEKISEASRKQRKGRVGRDAEGTVYYVYEKSSREDIKPKFKISQMNFEDNFMQLLKKDQENNNILVPKFIDPNNIDDYISSYNELKIQNNLTPNAILKLTVNKFETITEESEVFKRNILFIILKQYNIKNINYKDYWNNLYYDNIDINFERFATGFSINNLVDLDGKFYLIHPYESLTKRNILNNIIEFNNKKTDKIDETIFSEMLSRLNYKNILISLNKQSYFTSEKIFNFDELFVCEIYNFILEITQNTEFIETTKEGLVVLASIGFDCLYEVVGILTMLKIINNSMKNLLIKIESTYNQQDSEIEYIYQIINNLKTKFYNFNLFKINSLDYLKKKYHSSFIKLVNLFIKNYKINKEKIPDELNLEVWSLFINCYNNNTIYEDSCFETLLNIKSILTDEIFNDYKLYTNEIKTWCLQKNLKSEIILVFLDKYTKNIFDILTLQKNKNRNYSEPSIIDIMKSFSSSFIKTLKTNNINEKIIKSFLFGFTLQVSFKIFEGKYHTTINKIPTLNLDTKTNLEPYIFYFNYSKSNDFNIKKRKIINDALEIKITNKINIDWLTSILPIYYNYQNYKDKVVKSKNEYIFQKSLGYLNDNIIHKISNNQPKNFLFDNVNKLDYPILYNFISFMKKAINN